MLEKFMNHFHQSMYKSRGAAIREGTAEFSNWPLAQRRSGYALTNFVFLMRGAKLKLGPLH